MKMTAKKLLAPTSAPTFAPATGANDPLPRWLVDAMAATRLATNATGMSRTTIATTTISPKNTGEHR